MPAQKPAPVTLKAKINWQPMSAIQPKVEESTLQEASPPRPDEVNGKIPKPAAQSGNAHTASGLSPYHEARELDFRPEILEDIPINPPELRDEPAGGSLVLRLWINAGGGVDAASIERSSLPPPFAKQAISAFKNAKFRPGEKAGIPVSSTMRVELNYLPLSQPGRPEYLPSQLLDK